MNEEQHNQSVLALLRAVDVVGNASALASKTNLSRDFIRQLLNGQRMIPLSQCVIFEKATEGFVRCEEFRPDYKDYFEYLRALVV
jgi:DNA-binding transcriptional regulator YdaS (Cro superfamily)